MVIKYSPKFRLVRSSLLQTCGIPCGYIVDQISGETLIDPFNPVCTVEMFELLLRHLLTLGHITQSEKKGVMQQVRNAHLARDDTHLFETIVRTADDTTDLSGFRLETYLRNGSVSGKFFKDEEALADTEFTTQVRLFRTVMHFVEYEICTSEQGLALFKMAVTALVDLPLDDSKLKLQLGPKAEMKTKQKREILFWVTDDRPVLDLINVTYGLMVIGSGYGTLITSLEDAVNFYSEMEDNEVVSREMLDRSEGEVCNAGVTDNFGTIVKMLTFLEMPIDLDMEGYFFESCQAHDCKKLTYHGYFRCNGVVVSQEVTTLVEALAFVEGMTADGVLSVNQAVFLFQQAVEADLYIDEVEKVCLDDNFSTQQCSEATRVAFSQINKNELFVPVKDERLAN